MPSSRSISSGLHRSARAWTTAGTRRRRLEGTAILKLSDGHFRKRLNVHLNLRRILKPPSLPMTPCLCRQPEMPTPPIRLGRKIYCGPNSFLVCVQFGSLSSDSLGSSEDAAGRMAPARKPSRPRHLPRHFVGVRRHVASSRCTTTPLRTRESLVAGLSGTPELKASGNSLKDLAHHLS